MSDRLAEVVAVAVATELGHTLGHFQAEGLDRFAPNTVRIARSIAEQVSAAVAPTAAEREAADSLAGVTFVAAVGAEYTVGEADLIRVATLVKFVDRVRALVEGETP